MPIDSIGSVSPIAAAQTRVAQSRPPETTPSAQEAASQENDARRTAESQSGASPAYLAGPGDTSSASAVGTRTPVQASADTETTLRESGAEIARASASSSTADQRAASDAYQAAAAAQSDMARQQQGNGSQGINVLA
jgi:hypothetical protein